MPLRAENFETRFDEDCVELQLKNTDEGCVHFGDGVSGDELERIGS
jgi:hypothetical protein